MRYGTIAYGLASTPGAGPAAAAGWAAALVTVLHLSGQLWVAAFADFSYVATLLHPNAELLDEALIETIETAELKTQVC